MHMLDMCSKATLHVHHAKINARLQTIDAVLHEQVTFLISVCGTITNKSMERAL